MGENRKVKDPFQRPDQVVVQQRMKKRGDQVLHPNDILIPPGYLMYMTSPMPPPGWRRFCGRWPAYKQRVDTASSNETEFVELFLMEKL